ncbi:hypothetical protein FBUS_01754 [Fasciolopsis buskii]|uniref:Uncharacterized protein n=1 Tax=Fasciolopsis buskii TaxID=27845 RepID=A0A8E0VP80_9TREM|nr:hypothetical protein FBUS_01754 [Fasciolopsis buski]
MTYAEGLAEAEKSMKSYFDGNNSAKKKIPFEYPRPVEVRPSGGPTCESTLIFNAPLPDKGVGAPKPIAPNLKLDNWPAKTVYASFVQTSRALWCSIHARVLAFSSSASLSPLSSSPNLACPPWGQITISTRPFIGPATEDDFRRESVKFSEELTTVGLKFKPDPYYWTVIGRPDGQSTNTHIWFLADD